MPPKGVLAAVLCVSLLATPAAATTYEDQDDGFAIHDSGTITGPLGDVTHLEARASPAGSIVDSYEAYKFQLDPTPSGTPGIVVDLDYSSATLSLEAPHLCAATADLDVRLLDGQGNVVAEDLEDCEEETSVHLDVQIPGADQLTLEVFGGPTNLETTGYQLTIDVDYG